MAVITATSEGQWAIDRLVARYFDFRESESIDAAGTHGRHCGLNKKIRYGNALVDLVAIAEAFVVSRLLSIRTVQWRELSSWKSFEIQWQKRVTIELQSFEQWNSLMGYVEARNALQHGLGKLTDRQLDKKFQRDVLWKIQCAGIRRNGPDLIISSGDVTTAMAVCRGFISWLDVTAPLR